MSVALSFLCSAVRGAGLLSVFVLSTVFVSGLGLADPACGDESRRDTAAVAVDGLWSGVIYLKRGSLETEVFVELAPDHEGKLGGTISLPAYGLQYVPIDDLAIDGSTLSFTFSRYSAGAQMDVVSPIRGELSEDRSAFEGEYVEGGRNTYPITLEKTGPPGTEPPVREPGELIVMGGDAAPLKRAFDADRGKARALLLVSPTCPLCLNKARMMQRYLLDRVDSEALALYLVWGPMQGNETEAHARQATATLTDPRVKHYWTPVHDLAEAYMKPLGLADDVEPAWDTYLVFAPGVSWGEGVPAPDFFMWEEKPLPADGLFNAETFAAEIEKRLPEG